MKGNPDKCYLLRGATASIAIEIKDSKILNSEGEKILGVTIDSKLNFNNHLPKILKIANQKVHVLARITPYMSIPKTKLLMNSFFISQFNCCPLVWICHSRLIDYMKNTFVLLIVTKLTFEGLLDKDGSVTIHTFVVKYCS